jgi:hypothetical protein
MTLTKNQIVEKLEKMNNYTDFSNHFAQNALEVGTVLNGMKFKGETIVGYEVDETDISMTPYVAVVTDKGNKSGWSLIAKTQK